jgi:hypothetical protein
MLEPLGFGAFIIFGWGAGFSKDFGPVGLHRCPNCNNEAPWHLARRRKWFTLFFVPVFPYESTHMLLCPVCGRGIQVSGKELAGLKAALAGAGVAAPERIASQPATSAALPAARTYVPIADDDGRDPNGNVDAPVDELKAARTFRA